MTDRMAAFSDVVNGNIYLQSISQGIMTFLPVIIIGSFASLFSGLPVDFGRTLSNLPVSAPC